ncbi:MAG: type II secretion system GspH family protein [Gloeocapsa sp. UFS-A4-WI-NPMV-4B04]|jgi:prepilin-type N-terminal cleavage/methylation domain-containing protein|nr:type II secretion system GspH family protein [Gloeocapsa sp. UFS-A4-WI-NPMV-4B04]
MLKPKLPQQNEGFTLVEVLVAILITTIFVAVTMQSMVLAAVFKARARQFSEATTWIQEDLENVKSQATLQSTTLSNELDATPGSYEVTDTAIVVASANRFKFGDQLKIGTDSTNNVIQSIAPATSTITLNVALDTIQLPGVSVELIRSTRCTGTPTLSTGFGDYLNDNLPPVPSETNNSSNPNSGTKTILGKTYTVTRIPTVKDVAPYEVLELSYRVAPQGGGSAIATTNNEVIPDAAFQCP